MARFEGSLEFILCCRKICATVYVTKYGKGNIKYRTLTDISQLRGLDKSKVTITVLTDCALSDRYKAILEEAKHSGFTVSYFDEDSVQEKQ